MRGTTIINIGGEDRPIYFGTNQTRIYCELRKLTLSEAQKEQNEIAYYKEDENGNRYVESKSDGGDLIDLVYSALYAGARFKKKEVDFTNEDVGFWLDDIDNPDKFWKEFYSCAFSLNDGGSEPIEPEADDSKKK